MRDPVSERDNQPLPEEESAVSQGAALPEVEVLEKEETRTAWASFQRILYRVRGGAGEWITQEREFLDRGDAIALLPYCRETGNILLVRQFRMPVHVRRPAEAMLLEVCGGILDDADPEVTLRHEAVEELGIELGAVEHVFDAYSTPGSVCEKVFYFIAPYTPEQRLHAGGGAAHEGEDIEIVELPLREAVRMIRDGEILDARTAALVFYLAAVIFAPLR